MTNVLHAIRKLRELTWRRRLLLLRACARLGWTALNLRLRPTFYVRRRLQQTPRPSGAPSSFQPEDVAWAVAIAARYVPGGDNCLVQALAGAAIMARLGLRARVRLGVAHQGVFAAHAWVECGDRIVIGAQEAARYSGLPPTACNNLPSR